MVWIQDGLIQDGLIWFKDTVNEQASREEMRDWTEDMIVAKEQGAAEQIGVFNLLWSKTGFEITHIGLLTITPHMEIARELAILAAAAVGVFKRTLNLHFLH